MVSRFSGTSQFSADFTGDVAIDPDWQAHPIQHPGRQMKDTYVSLDLEMTSARPENQDVIEIAAIKFHGERVLDSWSTLVRPKIPLPYNVQVLTGISPDDLARAPGLSEVAGQLLAFVGRLPLVAHTVSSDVNCLRRQGVVLENPQVDTFELASVLLPQRSGYSLAALVQHFGIPFPTQHRAAPDALVTKELFLALWQTALELDLSVVQEINRLVAGRSWPLEAFFRQVEAEKAQTAMGTSIRQQLSAKGAGGDLPLEVLLLTRREEPALTPKTGKQPVDPDGLAQLVEADGPLGQKLDGYEYRPQQVEMLKGVAAAFNDGENLIVEAGTGTGKSLAYLLPAVHFSIANGERVVISTNTINLQDQLCQKDIPDIQRLLGLEFKSALVKGRSNYLCLQRWTTLPSMSIKSVFLASNCWNNV